MSDKVQRKLVGAQRYMSVATGPEPVEKGQTVWVTAEEAVGMDDLTYVDAAGTTKRLFVKVKSAVVVQEEEEEEEEEDDDGVVEEVPAESDGDDVSADVEEKPKAARTRRKAE
jgi:hypothetical protein